MLEAISILFGFNLPNSKNAENMLSHSIYNACEVSQSAFLKSGSINQSSCNSSELVVPPSCTPEDFRCGAV